MTNHIVFAQVSVLDFVDLNPVEFTCPSVRDSLVFAEGLILTGSGIILGLLLGHGGLALASDTIRDTTGLALHPWRIAPSEMIALASMAACGLAATLIPTVSCYRRTPIADLHLTD